MVAAVVAAVVAAAESHTVVVVAVVCILRAQSKLAQLVNRRVAGAAVKAFVGAC